MYTYKSIKSITKFSSINFLSLEFSTNINSNLGNLFWDTIFSQNYFKDFFEKKYLPYKKSHSIESTYKNIVEKGNFIIDKLNQVNSTTCLRQRDLIPLGEEIVFAFRIYKEIILLYNEYYRESDFSISLTQGIEYKKSMMEIGDLFYFVEGLYSKGDPCIIDIILPMFEELDILKQGFLVYKFEIYWPTEILQIALFSRYIKSKNPSSKIVVDFSNANEQFDFTQWIQIIKDYQDDFFRYFDFFIVYRDFSKGIKDIMEYLNHSIDKKPQNVIYKNDEGLHFYDISSSELSEEMFQNFIADNLNTKRVINMLGSKAMYVRFLPYKCYWNNCNFCVINTNNKYNYDRKYGYNFFVDAWVDFIEKNDIYSINFSDEAIPPQVMIQFAKKIIQRGLKINYKVRTRYDKIFTKENCFLLAKSGLGYIGLGLESAIDRVNIELGNKGNNDVNLKEKIQIIHFFDKAGVSIHNYSILGFPGETDQEILTTYSFLVSNIEKSQHFTCTPNVFSLMKGSKIFIEREKYNISIPEKQLNNPFQLSYGFEVQSYKRNEKLLYDLSSDIHRIQFLPWMSKSESFIQSQEFWQFIDRSNLFYLMKRYHKKNPYHVYKDKNNFKLNFDQIISKKFLLSPHIQYIYEGKNMSIYNWINNTYTYISGTQLSFLENYDSKKTLYENLELFEKVDREFLVNPLIKNKILIML